MAKYLNNQDIHNLLQTPSGMKFTDKGYPIIEPVYNLPDYFEIMGYNYAKSSKETDKSIHFFLEDYMFNQVWNSPEPNMKILKKYASCFSPDFSLYRNMPVPMQQWNCYRKQWCGAYWQLNDILVIPTICWSDERSYDFCFEGIPKNSIISISTLGALREPKAKELFIQGWHKTLEVLEPKLILLYGSRKMSNELPGNIRYLLNIEFE